MCLGIPGEVVELTPDHPDLAVVDVQGVHRRINVGLVHPVQPGDWLLIHLGFAMERLDEGEARATLRSMEDLGPGSARGRTTFRDGPGDATS